MGGRVGRDWAWRRWDDAAGKAWRGNYATASLLAGMTFFALLAFATVLKNVSPTPVELDESPMMLAKREAAREIFQSVYLAECELAALAAIEEPFRSFARKTGFYAPEAFKPALACLDQRLGAAGYASLETQLRSNRSLAILLDLECVGDMRQSELCARAFIFAKKRASSVAERLADAIDQGGMPPAERREAR